MHSISFIKMHGQGNDFVIIDARNQSVPLPRDTVCAIADRRRGLGCDQLIRLEPSCVGDVFMRVWNPDGSEAEACGNGTRCVARLMMEEAGTNEVGIETVSGVLASRRGAANMIDVDMGVPRLEWRDIPLAGPADTLALDLGPGAPAPATCINLGNPHAVLFVDDCDAINLAETGPLLENSPCFPERANISFVTVSTPSRVRARVWERGAGATLACGSAACAIVVAGSLCDLVDRRVSVSLPGGELELNWRENGHVHMAGPTCLVCSGTLSPEFMA